MLTGSGEAKGVACSERHRGNSAFDPSAEPVPGCHARFLRIPCLCSSRDRLKSHWVVASPIGQFCYRIPSQFVETVVRAQIDRGKRRGTVRTLPKTKYCVSRTRHRHTKLYAITMLQDHPSVSIISKLPASPVKAPEWFWCRRLSPVTVTPTLLAGDAVPMVPYPTVPGLGPAQEMTRMPCIGNQAIDRLPFAY